MTIAIGQQAKLVQPVVAGEVIDTRFNKEAGKLEHLLSFVGADGEVNQRWFLETDLEPA